MDVGELFAGIFEHNEPALLMYGRRVELLASNLANADTPNYKARDLDFAAIMADIVSPTLAMTTTDSSHVPAPQQVAELKYRVPLQASLDGNTVETAVEQAQFAENSVRYQRELSEVTGTIKDFLYALNGKE